MSENAGFREMIGTEIENAGEGRAVVSVQVEDRHLNPSGTAHGGVVSTLIDVAMAEAIKTIAGEGESAVTIEIKVNYIEPGQPGTLTATAQVRKGGKRVTITEAEVIQEESGEVVALATGTYTRIG